MKGDKSPIANPDHPAETMESTSGAQPSAVNFANPKGMAHGQLVGRGRFRLEALVGVGGMGEVWRATDERLQEVVALKFLSPKIRDNPTALAALRRETSRSHSLSHQHIVRIHDLHEAEDEQAFISMEYVAGSNLHQLARSRPSEAFDWEQVAEWLPKLCSGLDYAHSRGVIHRDIKPANLVLDSEGSIKLADFGLAEPIEGHGHPAASPSGGTLAYMSPQQLAGLPGTVTDDIYSLGATLFELLTGLPLFSGGNIPSRIEFEPAPSLFDTLERRGMAHSIPEEVDDLIQQCLAKSPGRRPQSANALLAMTGITNPGSSLPAPSVSISIADRFDPKFLAVLAPALLLAGFVLLKLLTIPDPEARGPLKPLILTHARAHASSSERQMARLTTSPDDPGEMVHYEAHLAFDGIHRSTIDKFRWVSAPSVGDQPEWLAVDLGADYLISRVTIDWELAHARDFSVRTRSSSQGFTNNPVVWTAQASVEGFGEITLLAVNEILNLNDVSLDFKNGRVEIASWMKADLAEINGWPHLARYVMIHMTAKGRNNPGVYSIHEVQIYASPLKP